MIFGLLRVFGSKSELQIGPDFELKKKKKIFSFFLNFRFRSFVCCHSASHLRLAFKQC